MSIPTVSADQTVKYTLKARSKTAVEVFRRDDPKYGKVDKSLCQNIKSAGGRDKARRQRSIMEGRGRSEEYFYWPSSSGAESKWVALEEEKRARLRHAAKQRKQAFEILEAKQEKNQGLSYDVDFWISDKKKMYQSGTCESSFPDFQSHQGLMTFRDILDTVLHLSDEEWTTLTEDMTHQYTKLKFASLCTEIVMSVSEFVIGKMMPDLIERFGIESVLRAEAKLKEQKQCESRSRAVTPSCSGQSLPEDSVETGITKMKVAVQAIKTVADELKKSFKNISNESDVKPETDDSVQLQNKPTWDTSLVTGAEEKDDHACRSGTLISSKKPCSGLQDAAPTMPDDKEEPSKLQADVDSCTEDVIWRVENLYLHEEKLVKSNFYQKPWYKRKMYIDSNAEMASGDSFFGSRSDVLLDEAAVAVRNILMEKAVPEHVDKPIGTLYDSGPFRSQFALKRAAMESGRSVVMILDQFYKSMQSIAGDATYSLDALAGFVGDAVDIVKEEPLKSARTTLKTVRSHLQEFLSKFSPEEIDWEENEQVIDLCTEEVINQAVHLYRNELTDPSSFTVIDILTSTPFQTKLSQRVSEIILQKLESCPSLMPTKGFSEGHLKDISSEISRSVSYTLQKFARAQLALRSSSSSQTPPSFFSPLFLFIKVKNKLKKSFSLFMQSPEKPNCSADDRVVPMYITDDSSDLVCNSFETAIIKIIGAMQETIRRIASGQKSKTVADEINISPESDVKPETDNSVQLQNKATRDGNDTLVKIFSRILSQTSLDPSVVTSSEAKDIIEKVVNGLVNAAEEKHDHACRSGTLISSKKSCSGLQDATPGVPDDQEEPSKLLADVDSCTEEVMWLEKLYLDEEQQAKSSFYEKPWNKGKKYSVSNAETASEDSTFFTSSSDIILDEAAMAVSDILMEKAVPEHVDKPIGKE
ncbi:hypothetical protein AMELA_G00128420 [Ameiurus melas]|uniref:Uncharacterized protein n=1 Tax=Ameiurus melas TaxID=219545 RepID=A0A7J6AQK0_AMEME|nr:hypothetical protein AMELA_G00128420 [Ameiurus melas]